MTIYDPNIRTLVSIWTTKQRDINNKIVVEKLSILFRSAQKIRMREHGTLLVI